MCIDTTLDENNETLNGEEFIVETIPEKLMTAFDVAQEKSEETIEKTKLPLPLRIIEYVTGFLALISLGVFARLLDEEIPFKEAVKENTTFLLVAVLSGLIWLALVLVSKTKEKIVMQEQDFDGKAEVLDDQIKIMYDALGVPADAPSVDILTFAYTEKDGEIVPQRQKLVYTPFFVNLDLRAYVKDGALCIAGLESVFAFPLEGMKVIRTVNERITIPSWNKNEDIKSPTYKPYKLKEEDAGTVLVKPYHILEFVREGETYGIYFPCYELPVFRSLLGEIEIEQA